MQKLDINKEIYIYLIGKRDFDEGLTILRKYEKRKAFINILSNKKRNHAAISKLHYALWRLTSLPMGVLHKKEKLEEYEKSVPAKKTDDHLPDVKETISDETKPESHSDQVIDQMNEEIDETEPESHYPPIINKIKEELAEQTTKRSALHRDLKAVGTDNDAKSIAKRKAIAEMIATVSARVDFLMLTKEDFFNDGVIPDEDKIYPKKKEKPAKQEVNIPKLMTREKNLISSITKDRNKLLYQSQKKEAEENPMPKGPKRDVVAKRVAEKEAELIQVRKILKNAN